MDIPFEFIVFCASFGLLFAGVFAAASFSKWIQVSRAAHWPVASGVVLRARVRGR